MSDMVERVARAIQAELRCQDVLYEDGEDLSRLMMMTGEAADLPAVCRAVIKAMREPTMAMVDAGDAQDGSTVYDDNASAHAHWSAMIDAALVSSTSPRREKTGQPHLRD